MKRFFFTTLTIMCVLAMIAAPKKSRERMTFDRNWSFRLCKDHAEVKIVLAELGIKDLRLGETKAKVQKNKVTDDTEPEQAQVTASEVTSATAQSAYGNKEFRSSTQECCPQRPPTRPSHPCSTQGHRRA